MRAKHLSRITIEEAREWMIDHWNADEEGTDFDVEILDDAFAAVFGRLPNADEDAFGALKHQFQNH